MKPALLALAALAACSAAPNPDRVSDPAPWSPPARTEKAATPAAPDAAASTEPDAVASTEKGAGPKSDASVAPASTPAPSSSTAKPEEAPAREEGRVAVATVAGQPIDVSELLAQWLQRASPEVHEELDQVVVDRVVQLESARLGIQIASEKVEQSFLDHVAEFEKELDKSRPGTKLDDYVERSLGLDAKTYRNRMRRTALRTLLAERVCRTWMLTSEHALARMIVVRTEADAGEVQALLATGKPFEEVARERSVDGAPSERGRLVPVIKIETPMSRFVFQTPVGETAGPFPEQGAFVFVQVVERPDPLPEPPKVAWAELERRIEASLARRPVDNLEIAQWQAAMERRYEIDKRPFFRLAGEPVGDAAPAR